MCSRLNSGDHQRGKAVCPNGLDAPLELADAAVLTDIERYVLHPRVVRRALTLACQELRPPAGRIERERSSLQRGLHAVDGELSRLTTALASGGDLSSLVEAIRDREQRRETLAAQLAQLAQVRDLQGQNVADLERRLRAKLANWRELLRARRRKRDRYSRRSSRNGSRSRQASRADSASTATKERSPSARSSKA